MKFLRNTLIALAIVVLLLALLVWFAPARWILPWLRPQLHGVTLQGVQGSVWDGRAAEVGTAGGTSLGHLQWSLSRRLLLGDLQMTLQLQGPRLDFTGALHRLGPGKLEWRAVDARVDLALLSVGAQLPLGRPSGEVLLQLDRAVLQGGWPLQLQGVVRWQRAALATPQGEVTLGNLHGDVQALGGVLWLQATDDGAGPLQLDGQFVGSPLGWRLNAVLASRRPDPALQQLLLRLGPPDASGTVHVHQSAGLGTALPLATPHRQRAPSPKGNA